MGPADRVRAIFYRYETGSFDQLSRALSGGCDGNDPVCVSMDDESWNVDFRNDVAKIDVPTLVIHGEADRIVPFSAAGQRTAKLVKGARLVAIKDGPHCVIWTHADEVNAALSEFLGKGQAAGAR